VRWKLSRTVLRGGIGGNTGPLPDEQLPDGKKRPWAFRLPGDKLFAFAGLYSTWHPPGGEPVATCCILTTTANEVVKQIHDRMPVILDPTDYDAWLDPKADPAHVRSLLRPLPDDAITGTPLKPIVNSVKNNGPECLTPA
jgi:putative SOS response-associated peptidase YedK